MKLQHTTTTATQREEMVDSKELLALIEKRKNIDRKEKAQVKDISKRGDLNGSIANFQDKKEEFLSRT